MSVVGRLSNVLRRRRVQVVVAVVALGGAVTAVAVANISLLGVAGGAPDHAGGLSSRLDLGSAPTRPAATTTAPTAPTLPTPATSPATATTTAATAAATTAPATTPPPTPTTTATSPAPTRAATTERDDDHGAPDRDGGDEGARDDDD